MKNDKKIKIGLALGSGGAKGTALIGALRAFEEANLSFDIIAGTSIGSVVGALYARGYTSEDMMNLKDESGLADPRSLIAFTLGTASLKDAISGFIGGAYFSDLKKPFTAVATNLDSGEEVDMSSGDLASALAGSCAIPPVFRAVNRDGMRLVDGAFVNYVPADVVKSGGADVVISINLGKGQDDNSHIKRILDELYPENGVKRANRSRACYEFSDLVIEPDLADFKSSSVHALDEMYLRGYTAAKLKIEEIVKLIDDKRK